MVVLAYGTFPGQVEVLQNDEHGPVHPPAYTFDKTRLASLAGFDVLDTLPEPGFDDIVELATQVCQTPVALVSLVTEDRQWFKARVAFPACETDLNSSVCAHALVEPDLLIIPDLTLDRRTQANPLVTGDPHIRFYAGAPLRASDGHVLGSLCVIDVKPRAEGLTQLQASGLRNLARQVISQLELRRALAERDALLEEQLRAQARRNGLLRLGDRLLDMSSVADMSREASAIVGEILQADRVAFGRLDDAIEYIDIDADWTAAGMTSIAGRHRFHDYGDMRQELLDGQSLIIEDVRTDPRTNNNPGRLLDIGATAIAKIPVREHGRVVAVLIVHCREPRSWRPETLIFLRNVADRVELGVARVKAEAEQRLLNQEMSHRIKNMMTMVQAIAVQTLKPISDREPVQAFEKRIHALSVAHEVLLQLNWSAASIRIVVNAALQGFTQSQRFDLSGPDLDVGPRAALSLSLLLHELTTNALKYGALSNDTGRVIVDWRVLHHGPEADIILSWREIDGPPATAPTRIGFGSRIVRMGLVGSGGVDLRFEKTGLEAEFRASLAEVQRS